MNGLCRSDRIFSSTVCPRYSVVIFKVICSDVVTIGHSVLVTITGMTKLTPYHLVKSLQLDLRVPDLQISCSDLTVRIGHQDSSLSNVSHVTCPKRCPIAGLWAHRPAMGHPLWVRSLTSVLPLSLLCCRQYCVILDHVIMRVNCIADEQVLFSMTCWGYLSETRRGTLVRFCWNVSLVSVLLILLGV